MGLAMGSQAALGFSWERNGPLKAWEMALRLKAQTAEAAMLFLEGKRWNAVLPVPLPLNLNPAVKSQVAQLQTWKHQCWALGVNYESVTKRRHMLPTPSGKREPLAKVWGSPVSRPYPLYSTWAVNEVSDLFHLANVCLAWQTFIFIFVLIWGAIKDSELGDHSWRV